MKALHTAARHGRVLLVLGLIAGAALPGAAHMLREAIPYFIALLLTLTALRVGHKTALGSFTALRRVLALVACLQMAAPLFALVSFAVLGVLDHPFALAVVLMLAAPAVTGTPNFLIMMGLEPAHAMRILVVGTAVFPVTAIPILMGLPILDTGAALIAASKLIAVILCATAFGFALRHVAVPNLSDNARLNLDGLSAITLAVVVIGLMSEIGPLLRHDPKTLSIWAFAVLLLNFGLQIFTFRVTKHVNLPEMSAISVASGNRNIALFLVALPVEVTGPLLVFIGCYQIPMYLTPIVMKRMYRAASA